MRLALFGATGKTGQHVLQQALAAGHHVRALVRTPAKLNLTHDHLTVVPGDAQDAAKVAETIVGADVVISVLGPTENKPLFAVTHGTQNMLAAMKQHGVHRLVLTAGAAVPDPHDKPQLIHHLINFLVKSLSRHVYDDMARVVETVRNSDIDWTIVRVPMLTDAAPLGALRVGYVGTGPGPRLTRADLARFLLQQVASATHLRQAPAVSN